MDGPFGGVVLGERPAGRPHCPAERPAVRVPFAALVGVTGGELAAQAARLAVAVLPAAWDSRPRLVGPSGSPVTPDPEPVTRQRTHQRLAALVGPSGERLLPPWRLRAHEPTPAPDPDPEPPAWAELAPGVELAEIVDELEPRALDVDDLVRLAQAHGRQVAHHEAGLVEALAALTRRAVYGACTNVAETEHDRVKAAADEVAAAMGWTPSYADRQVRAAVELVDELPATLAALRAGRIDRYKAGIIAEETAPLAGIPEVRARVEEELLAKAADRSGPQLRAYAKKAVLRAAPELAERRRKTARKGRRVERPYPEIDGMGSMTLFGPIEDLAAFFAAVDAAARARRDTGADATLDELRFDVVADVAWGALSRAHLGCCNPECGGAEQRLGTRQGRRATVGVTVPYSTLAGIDDEPGELHGYGPIHAATARRIAADATLRRLVTDPVTGQLLDYGRTRYEPPQHLRDHVVARDVTCRFPTCNWTADACQLDHTVAHRADGTGGATADYNLGAWHDRHHNGKTSHGWVFEQPEPGRFIITSPAGLRYEVGPEPIGPIMSRPPPMPSDRA